MLSVRNTPRYASHEEYRNNVANSSLSKLFTIKGTTTNKSYSCTPIVKSIIQEDHGEHISIDSCRKCQSFYKKFVELSAEKVKRLQNVTINQSASVLWKNYRKLRVTANSAPKIPIKDTTDATSFIHEHLHPFFTGNKFTRHGLEQEPIAKSHLKTLGNSILDSGMCVSFSDPWFSGSPDGILNEDTILEVKCPLPMPNKWTSLDELISGGKYDVIKSHGQYKLKVKGSRGYYLQIQLTMYCTGQYKARLCVWRCPDDYFSRCLV